MLGKSWDLRVFNSKKNQMTRTRTLQCTENTREAQTGDMLTNRVLLLELIRIFSLHFSPDCREVVVWNMTK